MAKGIDIVNVLLKHEGDDYVFGALTPVGAKNPHVFDCSKFASWGVYQASKIIYGTDNNYGNPMHVYGGTIYWNRDVKSMGKAISVSEAAAIPGAAILRLATGSRCGHIVISQGNGRTIEAASSSLGVVQLGVNNRRWSTGILVPGIEYDLSNVATSLAPPATIYHIGSRGDAVKKIQAALGIDDDGIFGPITEDAVEAFQREVHLVPDGEVGPLTLNALELTL